MEQTLDLLLGDLRSGKKELNRLFFVGLFFALATHFYVVEPYFFFKLQEASLADQKISIQLSLETILSQESELRKTQKKITKGLNKIRERINSLPKHLRDSLPDIRHSLQENINDRQENRTDMQQQAVNFDDDQDDTTQFSFIIIPEHITEFSPAVHWYIDDWFKKLLFDLDQTVVSPLMALAQQEKIAGAEQLDKLAREAVQKIQKKISDIKPDFWRTYSGRGGKQEVARDVQQTIKWAFNPLETEVEQILEQTKKLRLQQSNQLKELETELAAAGKNISELSDQLKSLESPFGRIPLRLTDLIRIFPFILAGMAIILTVRLNQSLLLRTIIQKTFDQDGRNLPKYFQEYQLGGWLFPVAKRKRPLILLAGWFIIISYLSCRAAWLIGWTSMLFETQTAHVFTNQTLYKLCCSVALVMMVLAAFISMKNLYHASAIPEVTKT